MVKSTHLFAAALVALAAPTVAQVVKPVEFSRGRTQGTITGSIRGYQYIDYQVPLVPGQRLTVTMDGYRGSPYFNVLEPGQGEVAIFVGSTSGNRFSDVARMAGNYTIRVYMMRSAARRNENAAYHLTIDWSGRGAGAPVRPGRPPVAEGTRRPAYPNAPTHHPGDALVRETPYHAVSVVRCRSVVGAPMSNCKAGVIRRLGSATIHLDTPDGGERTILFRDGRAVSSDASVPIRVTRRGDTSIVAIGRAELYEIPDALPLGG